MRIISRKEVENSLTMGEAIEVVKKAFIELSNKTAIVPPRIHLSIEKHRATTLVMPSYLSKLDGLACKIVSVFPHNSAKKEPVIYGLVTLFDAANGKPLAVIEGASLTTLRTGAATGLATDLLARQDAENLAIIGAGAQSKTQIEAVCAVRKIKKISVFDNKKENAEELIRQVQNKLEVTIIISESATRAIAGAEVICTATTSKKPVFDGGVLQKGTHINGIGSFTREMQEIDFKTLQRASKIVVDSKENCLKEAGDLVQAIEKNIISESDIYAEIGDIASVLKAGRENESEITFFKSVGNAVQDTAVAQAIYQVCFTKGIGIEVDF